MLAKGRARASSSKEKTVGLAAAPLGAAISLLVIDDLIAHDPPAVQAGLPDRLHVGVGLYHEALAALLLLSLAMLAAAWFDKHLYLGMAAVLLGAGISDLRYWGFGAPFVLFGAWVLVRAYRRGRATIPPGSLAGSPRETRSPSRSGRAGAGRTPANPSGPKARPAKSGRYTPPA